MKRSTLIIALIVVVVVLAIARNFIFTTTTSQPAAMKLILPKEPGPAIAKTEINATLTLLLYNDSTVFAFRGIDHSKGKVFTVTDPTFRNYLIQTKNNLQDIGFTVIIKPDQTSSYKTTVDVLDEMA